MPNILHYVPWRQHTEQWLISAPRLRDENDRKAFVATTYLLKHTPCLNAGRFLVDERKVFHMLFYGQHFSKL